MKAVIVEIRKNNAAALTDDGCVIKIENNNYAIGEVIYLEKKHNFKKSKFTLLASCAAAVVILFGITAWAYFTPYTYVSLDVNPSIEYVVNRFDRVLSAEAVNNDGIDIVEDINLTNMSIDEAVKSTVDAIEEKGYFEGQDPGGIVISTSSEDEKQAQQLAEKLQEAAKQETEEGTISVEVEALSVGLQRVNEAHALGTTPGKLNLVQKLQSSSSNPNEINIEEWLHKPVKEIMKAVKQNRKGKKDITKQESIDSSAENQSEALENKSLQQTDEAQNSLASNTSPEIKVNGKKLENHPEKSSSSNKNKAESKVSENPVTSQNSNNNVKKNNSNNDNGNKMKQKQKLEKEKENRGKSMHSKK